MTDNVLARQEFPIAVGLHGLAEELETENSFAHSSLRDCSRVTENKGH